MSSRSRAARPTSLTPHGCASSLDRLISELEQEGCESLHYYFAAWTLVLCDRLDEADRALEAAASNARFRGSRLGPAAAACFRSSLLVRRGRVAEADAAARSALEVAEGGWELGLPLAAAFRTDALLERDELAAATEVIDGAGVPGANPDSGASYLALGARGRLRVAKGEVEAALRDLLECGRSDAAWGSRFPGIGAWRSDAARPPRRGRGARRGGATGARRRAGSCGPGSSWPSAAGPGRWPSALARRSGWLADERAVRGARERRRSP
jgi:hypothetical protein